MTVENTPKPLENSPERRHLYQERPSFSAERLLHEIEQLQSGEKPKEPLTEEEFQEAKEFEAPFVEELAKLRSISIDMNTLYPEYFDTPEGQVILSVVSKFTSIDKTPDGFIDIRQNIHNLRNLDSDSLERLRGKSSAYNTQTMLDKLSNHITEEGDLDIDGLDNPEKLMFVKKPDNLTKKIEGLRDLNSRLTQEMPNLFQIESSIEGDNKAAIHYKISRLKDLIKKVNVLLAEALENQSILDAEADLSSHKPKVRLDKFRYGVGKMNSDGNYDQVDNRLLQQADEIAKTYIEINQKKESILAEQGLDIKKIEKENIEPKRIKEYLDRILLDYGLLSEYPADADEVANNIKPPDNKWRCYVKSGQKTFEIDSKSKTLWIPIKKRSVADVLTKGAVHEIIHILQRENTAEIDIPLYTHPSQMGGDRSDLFQEGGAMYYQDKASQELFGFANPPLPHYLRAMAVKQAGGDYLACVKAYYESSMSIKNIKTEEESEKEEIRIKAIKTALSSAGRLFRNTPDLNNRNPYIPSTKDTVYLEQKAVVEEIMSKHPELRNIILVSGMNLETAKELIKFGLLDLSTLRKPDLSFVKALWEEMRDDYKLDTPTSETTPSSP
jgi:hypothetical protein